MDVKRDSSIAHNIFTMFGYKQAKRKGTASHGDVKSAKDWKADNGNDIASPSPRSTNVFEEGDSVHTSSAMSDDHSYSSSGVDEESVGRRDLGTVVKLMGLDSLPVNPSPSEPGSLTNAKSALSSNSQTQEKGGNTASSGSIDILRKATGGYPHAHADSSLRKMSTSRIERFQLEVVPPRTAKPFADVHKLVSPIRGTAHFSNRNASDIMEAASRLMEANSKTSATINVLSFQSSSSPISIYKPRVTKVSKDEEPVIKSAYSRGTEPASSKMKGKARATFSQSRLNVLATEGKGNTNMDIGTSSSVQSRLSTVNIEGKTMHERGKSVSASPASRVVEAEAVGKLSKGSATSTTLRAPMNVTVTKGLSILNEDKSRRADARAGSSIGAKQRINRRREINSEGMSLSPGGHARLDNPKMEGTSSNSRRVDVLKNHDRGQFKRSTRTQKKPRVVANDSHSIVQRKRLHDLVVPEDRLNRRQSSENANANQQRAEALAVNSFPEKLIRNDVMPMNESHQRSLRSSNSDPSQDERSPSTSRYHAYTERSPESISYSGKSSSSDGIAPRTTRKRIHHNLVLDERSYWPQHNRVSNGDIVSFTFTLPVDKLMPGSYVTNRDGALKNNGSAEIDPTHGSSLGLLLVQKLNALTSGARSPYNISITAPVLRDTSSVEESSSMVSADFEGESFSSCKDPDGISQASLTSENDQATFSGRCSKDQKDPEQLSELSPSEALSTGSVDLPGSWKSSTARESSSTEVTKLSFLHPSKFLEDEYATDTSSSVTVMMAETPSQEIVTEFYLKEQHEQEFLREVVAAFTSSGDVSSVYLAHRGNMLDSQIFENLYKRRRSNLLDENEKNQRTNYKMLFECGSELLTAKCSNYFDLGYRSWFKGTSVLGRLSAEELYGELNCSQVADNGMVDELVGRELSTTLERWLQFDVEVFEAGVEIQTELLNLLIDELIDDLLTKTQSKIARLSPTRKQHARYQFLYS